MLNLLICCCRNKKFKDYKAQLKKADRDVNMNLDLIQFIRRIRMHGAALTILLKGVDRGYLYTYAKVKNIDEIDLTPPKRWNQIESLSYSERIAIGILARHQFVSSKEKWANWFDNKIEPQVKE